VKRKERELGAIGGNPPGVKFCAVVRGNPNVLDRKARKMPITCKTRRKVRKKDEMRFENAQKQKDLEIDKAENDQEATKTEGR